jgi:hypothetical protein
MTTSLDFQSVRNTYGDDGVHEVQDILTHLSHHSLGLAWNGHNFTVLHSNPFPFVEVKGFLDSYSKKESSFVFTWLKESDSLKNYRFSLERKLTPLAQEIRDQLRAALPEQARIATDNKIATFRERLLSEGAPIHEERLHMLHNILFHCYSVAFSKINRSLELSGSLNFNRSLPPALSSATLDDFVLDELKSLRK